MPLPEYQRAQHQHMVQPLLARSTELTAGLKQLYAGFTRMHALIAAGALASILALAAMARA